MYHRLTAVLICSILILTCGFALCAPVKTEPPKPIPTGPECYTQAKLDEALAKVHYRTIVEAYRKVGVRDPKWDDKAVSFLEGYAKTIGKPLDPSFVDQSLKNGEELVTLGCTDPMVFYAYATAFKIKRNLEQAETYFRKSLAGFENGKYPKVRVRLAPVELNRICKLRKTATKEESARLGELARKWNLEMLTDGSFLPGEERLALSLIYSPLDEFPYPTQTDLYEAVKKLPGVSPYITGVVGGRCHIGQGWEERGTGWATDVTDEGWKGLEENMRTAYRLLVAAWKLHPDYPEAPCSVIRIAMAGYAAPWETPRLWFDRAVAAQMDYGYAYSAYFEALLPRWGGTHKKMYDFGVECLRTGRFDTQVPAMFVNAVNTTAADIEPDRTYMDKPETAQYVKQLWDGYEKSGKMGSPEFCRTMKALSLWKCGHYADAKVVLDQLGDRADQSVYQHFQVSPDKVREDVETMGAGPGQGLVEVQALYDKGKLPEALAACEQVMSKAAGDKGVTLYARKWLTVLKTEIDLAKGGWVTITPESDHAGWTNDGGGWNPTDDGGMQGVSDKAEVYSTLSGHANVGSHVELKGEFEVLSPDGSATITFDGRWRHVNVGFPKGMTQVDVSWMHANWGSGFGNPGYQEHNTFAIRYWDGKVSVDVNGKSVGEPAICNPDRGNEKNLLSDPTVYLTLGGMSHKGGCTVKFKNLQVRRLTEMPADIAKKIQAK